MPTLRLILLGAAVMALPVNGGDEWPREPGSGIDYDPARDVYIVSWIGADSLSHSFEFIPSTHVCPTVHTDVRWESGLFTYGYHVQNCDTSEQRIAAMSVQALDTVFTLSISGNWIPFFSVRDPEFKLASAIAIDTTSFIAAGDSGSFIVQSPGLPGIDTLHFAGDVLPHWADGEEFPGFPLWITDSLTVLCRLDINDKLVSSVCPAYSGSLGNADYCDSLCTDADDALNLGWFADTAARDTVISFLREAGEAIRSQNNELAVGFLRDLQSFIEREHPARVHDHAYVLYNAACEYLIARLQ